MTLITAIVPTHNSAKTILRALNSIENQDWHNIEIVCVDDASSDNTVELITRFSQDSQLTFKVISQKKNLGAGATRNIALDNANGEYIAFLDADDEWYPEKLSAQLRAMERAGAMLSHTYYERVGLKRTKIVITSEKITYRDMLLKNHLGTSTVMVRRSFLASRRFPLLRKRQDYGFWLELLRAGDISLAVPIPLTKYHIEPGSLSRTSVSGLFKYNYLVFRECQGFSIARSIIHVFLNALSRALR